MPRRLLLAAALLLGAAPLAAQSPAGGDTAAVVAAAQRVLDAINRRDSVLARASLVPGAQFVSWRGDTVATRARVQRDSAFVSQIGDPKNPRMLERMWEPTVLIHGTIATVWAPYDFHIDGKWSHCGVDVFQLVRLGDGWKVAALSYTVERTGCPPSPLGAPRS